MAFTPREYDTNKLVTVDDFGNCLHETGAYCIASSRRGSIIS